MKMGLIPRENEMKYVSRWHGLVAASLIAASAMPAYAQDKASVGALRFVSSGGLYLAFDRGYFKAENIDLEIKYFEAAQPIAVAVASGDINFGVTAITAGTLNLAGKGAIKIIASQGAEKKGVKGNALVVSNEAWTKGVQTVDKLPGTSIAITQVGSSFHYQLGQIAATKSIDLDKITLKPLQSIPNMVAAVKTNQVDGAIIPPHIAGPMVTRGEGKIVTYFSDLAEYQFGALFASPKVVSDNKALAERFVRAYQKGMADYNDALLRLDAKGEKIVDDKTKAAATIIGKYVYPSDAADVAIGKVVESAVYVDPKAKIDVADIEKQIAWYKKEKLVDASVDGKAFIDTSFVK
jgi:NitT/TauT family transport system substrate-binding protein